MTAVLVDGELFIRRQRRLGKWQDPESAVKGLLTMALGHMKDKNCRRISHLYRILFYDALPLARKAYQPVSGSAIDFSKSNV